MTDGSMSSKPGPGGLADTLGMSADEMRRLGYRVVDMVVEHLAQRGNEPAIQTGDFTELMGELGGPVPENPGNADAALDLLVKVALANQQHGDHPRFMARVPGPSSFAAILGDWLGTGYNTIASSWIGASGPTTVELVVIDWLRQLLGLPSGTEGILMSGGAMASFTALSLARTTYGNGAAYISDQTHYTVKRNLLQLGFAEEHIRVLPTDDAFRMPIPALAAAVTKDRASGLRPVVAVASAGTVNTGAVDDLEAISRTCKQHDMWFHIDGAYGAPAAISSKGRQRMAGLDKADSLSLDPHKWLFQPYEVGVTLVTRPGSLEKAYAMSAEYLTDVEAKDKVNFRSRSLELTRRSRALKMWLSLRVYGAARMRQAIEQGMALAEKAEALLRQYPDVWEIVSPAQLGIVCFAARGAGDKEHAARAAELAKSGYAAVGTTLLRGRTVFRMCMINPLTKEEDIRGTLARLAG
jgi:aromatic-L-amino-acid decarboxylase